MSDQPLSDSTPATAATPQHREGCPGGFHFGPCWSVNDGCCGKPVGCSVTAESCRMLNHPWKREVHGTGSKEDE